MQALTLTGLAVICLLSLRRPFIGVLTILVTFILSDTVALETYGYFYWYHSPAALYVATLLGVLLVRGERLGEFVPRGMMDWGMLGFLLVMLISASVNGVQVFEHKYISVFFQCVVLYFLLSRLTDTPRRATIVAVAVILSTSYLAYLAWWKYRAGWMDYARPYYFSSWHFFGLRVVVTLPLIGAMIARKLWLPLRLTLFALIPLFVLVGLRTQSRSAYLGIGVGLLMLAWFHRRRWYYFALAVPIVAYAVAHNPQAVLQRLESIWTHRTGTGQYDQSIRSRLEQMRTAMRVIQSNPLFGVGPRQFFQTYEQWVSQEDQEGGSYTMHSVPLLILTEEGLLGVFFFYGLLVIGTLGSALFVTRRARSNPELEPTAIVAAGALMGFVAWLGFSLGQPEMWSINIYATVAVVSACRRIAVAHVAEVAAEAESAAEGPVPALPPGAGTEIVFS